MNIVLIVSLSVGSIIILALVIAVLAIMLKRPTRTKVRPTEVHAMKSMNMIDHAVTKVEI